MRSPCAAKLIDVAFDEPNLVGDAGPVTLVAPPACGGVPTGNPRSRGHDELKIHSRSGLTPRTHSVDPAQRARHTIGTARVQYR